MNNVDHSRLNFIPTEHIERTERLKEYLAASQSNATIRGYAADWEIFEEFCYVNGLDPLPASPATVALFLTEQAEAMEEDEVKIARKLERWLKAGSGRKSEDFVPFKYKVASIERRRSAINDFHNKMRKTPPAQHEDAYLITATMRGIKRVRSRHEDVYKAAAATDEIVLKLLDHIKLDTLKDIRDAAIIAFGFASAMRRSELSKLTMSDLKFTDQGIEVLIRGSKTDKTFQGQTIAVPHGRIIRPVAHLQRWLDEAHITHGPVFRRLYKNDRVSENALDDNYISQIIKKRAENAKLEPSIFSGHSLRSGFITTAAIKDVPLAAIAKQSRHKSIETVNDYVQAVNKFKHYSGNSFV